MIRVDIETIVMATHPVPSLIVLRERDAGSLGPRSLSIQTGTWEAACVGRGMDEGHKDLRPLTHDLLISMVARLGGRIERIEINHMDTPVFYAEVIVSSHGQEISFDARPSDAIALAVRTNAPIYVEDDVMNRAGNATSSDEHQEQEELNQFDSFVHSVSPDDF